MAGLRDCPRIATLFYMSGRWFHTCWSLNWATSQPCCLVIVLNFFSFMTFFARRFSINLWMTSFNCKVTTWVTCRNNRSSAQSDCSHIQTDWKFVNNCCLIYKHIFSASCRIRLHWWAQVVYNTCLCNSRLDSPGCYLVFYIKAKLQSTNVILQLDCHSSSLIVEEFLSQIFVCNVSSGGDFCSMGISMYVDGNTFVIINNLSQITEVLWQTDCR